MFNHWQYNQKVYEGNNFGFATNTPPSYDTSVITAVANIEQGAAVPKFVIGGKSSTASALLKKSTSYAFSMWQSKVYNIGEPFNVVDIGIPLSAPLETDTLIFVVLRFDDGEKVVASNPIRLMNYTDAPSRITLGAGNFDYNVHGERNLTVELHFRGTLTSAMLPIECNLETEDRG